MSNTPNYDINYDDKRFTDVTTAKEDAISDLEQTYWGTDTDGDGVGDGGLIGESDSYFQAQIDAANQWAETQKQLQNEQTAFTIQKIEQEKAQAKKDYTKEQSGAYVDWQKQSNEYGANAEAMAAQGMAGTGYSESSQVSMYNTYQNRITSARESYQLAVQNYNNAITEAKLANNAALAEIAYQALQTSLELSMQGFQYKNQLIKELADKKMETEQYYYQQWQDVLDQMNKENSLAEQIRQHNADMEYKNAMLAEEKRQFDILHPQTAVETTTGGDDTDTDDKPKGGINKPTKSTNRSKFKNIDKVTSDKLKSSKSSSGKVDVKSLNALGHSGKSAKTVNDLVKDGFIKEVVDENGNISFKSSTNAIYRPRNKYMRW